MRNPKSQTRKIGPASISSILPPPGRRATKTCPPAAQNKTSEPKSRNTQHAPVAPKSDVGGTRLSSSQSRITPRPEGLKSGHHASRTRNGKVARLPHAVRDMINRMLRNNIPHSQIVGALEELNFRVTERNISNWKTRGGYRDWCIAQDRALETRLLQDNLLAHLRTSDASQLAEVGLQLVATELSQFFLKPETRQQLNTDPEKLARTIGILCRLARQIHLLQKHRDQSAKELGDEHNPERFKRETDETIENIRDIYSAEKPSESPEDPYIPHHNFLPKNGYPPEPPDDTPEDTSHIDHNIKLFEAAFASARAQYESQFPHQTSPAVSPAGSAARAASSDSIAESEHLDGATSEPPLPCGAQSVVSKTIVGAATRCPSVLNGVSEETKAQVNSELSQNEENSQ